MIFHASYLRMKRHAADILEHISAKGIVCNIVKTAACLLLLAFTLSGAKADCQPSPNGLISWWPGDGNANDIAATNHGILQGGATAAFVGQVGNSFFFSGTNAYVQIPDSPALRPTNFTIETWVKLDAMNSPGSTANPGVQFFVFKQNTLANYFEGFWLGKSRATGTDHFIFAVTSATGTFVPARSGIMQTGIWYHLAAVRGPNFIQLYTNGQMAAQAPVNFPQNYGNHPLYFGTSGQPSYDAKMQGLLDEVTFYNRALTASEIAAIYAAGTAGKCKEPEITLQPESQAIAIGSLATFTVAATGFGALTYQWRLDDVPLPGATNAMLTVTNLKLTDQGNYSVAVSNTFGLAISSNAWLQVTAPQPGSPYIVSMNPVMGVPGTNVTLTGFNFSATTTSNIVHFGAVRAEVVTASSNSLTVTVPLGATFARVSVTVDGLVANSPQNFLPTFAGNGFPVSGTTFAAGQNLGTGDGAQRTVIADLDGDGWPDLAVANLYANTISLFRNLGSGGPLSPGNFAARVDFPALAEGSDNPYGLIAADVDGDGKLDLVFTDRINNRVGIQRNQSSAGSLGMGSFAVPVYFNTGADPRYVRVADLNRDGRPDIVTCNTAAGTISILRNLSPAGILDASSFATRVDLTSGAGAYDVVIQDLDGDGRADLAVVNPNAGTLSLFRNISVPGTLNVSSFEPRVDLPANNDATIVAGDVDGDGRPDLISGGNSTAISIFRNLSTVGSLTTNSFAPKVDYGNPGWVHTVALGDVNGDAQADVVAVGELGSYLRVYQNQSTPGTVTLAAGVDYATGWNAWGVSVGDLDGDQRSDIIFCNAYEDTVTLYRNQQPFGGPPLITNHPASQTVIAGFDATLDVTATGTFPLSYQWLFNGTNIVGATNATLTLTNLQIADSGDYSVHITNAFGVTTSSNAVLTVIAPSCLPAPAGLIGWWQAESNGLDAASANLTTLSNGVAFSAGKVGQSFSFDGANDFIHVSPSASLNVGTNAGMTIECWINPASVAGQQPLAEWNDPLFPQPAGTHFWISVASAGSLYVNLVDTSGTSHTLSSPAGIVTPSTFQHVAITYNKTSGIATLYYNGATVATQNLGVFTPQTAYPLYFGYRPYGSGYFYTGLMDEIGIYDRALTSAEIQSVWQSTTLGHCATPPVFLQPLSNSMAALGGNLTLAPAHIGAQPMSYQWYFNNSALTNDAHLSGATSGQLALTAVQTNDAGNYWLVASNVAGVSTSSIAMVQVGFAPTIVLQPVGQTNMAGSTITFFTAATGSEPLSYQWYQNTTALTDDLRHFGATSTNLTITNLVTGDSGNYTLRVSNLFGITTSLVATLSVPTPPSITTQPRGYSVPVGLPVTLAGTASGSAPLRFQWTLNHVPVANATNSSLTISNLALANFGDYRLVVTNGGGAVTSTVAPLTVGTVAAWGNIGQGASLPIWPAAGLSNVVQVAAGSSYSLALRQDGTVYFWGNNLQVSNALPNLSGVVGIAAGPSHALALLSNGTVRAWGSNSFGQTNVPVTLSNVFAVAAGSAHSAALRVDGTVVVWGGSLVDVQTNIPAGLMKVTSIDAGGSQTLALREDGNLIAWGGRTPYPVPLDVKNVMGFSVGPGNSMLNLVVTSNGLVRAWGATSNATNVPANVSNIIAVEAAGNTDNYLAVALAVRSNRTVTSWGGGFSSSSILTNVPAGLSNVITLSGGISHALALVDNNGAPLILRPPIGGTFYSGRDLVLKAKVVGTAPLSLQWFKNGNPIPGGNNETLLLTFAQPSDAGSYHLIASNALGVAQSVAVPVTIADQAPVLMSQLQSRFAYYGSPFSVGASVIGSGPITFTWLQNGTPTYSGTNDLVFDRALPQHGGAYQLIVSNPFGSVTSAVSLITFSRVANWGSGPSLTNAPVDLGSVLGVASGYFHALAIRSNRTVAAWGTTLNGATNVPADLDDVIAVAGGSYFSVALKSNGSVVAWGINSSGQTNVPAGLNNVTAIAAGGSHTLALRADGTVAAWGLNSSGQTNVPAGLSNVVAIAAGSVHSLALQNNGAIVGWGLSGKIQSYTNVVAIAAGYGQSLALQANGTVLGWSTGIAATLLPPGLSNVVAISMGGGLQGWAHGAALRADGTVTTWGNNSGGQLNGLPELTSAIAISAGGGSTLAYLNDRSPFVATQPQDRHAISGTNVTFAALSVGQPALNFQWRLNGNDIPGATGVTLTVTNVSRNSRGLYSALVWNSLGSTNSRAAWLDVVGPVRLLATGSDAENPLRFTATDSSGNPLTAADLAWLQVQASTNLVNWQTLTNSLIFTNGALLLQDPAQLSYPARFFRLIEH
jgi:alpha-tubulin suppressor-like RCC1 family protein